ncbi:MAG: alanine racemase [Flavobacteriales bacterium]
MKLAIPISDFQLLLGAQLEGEAPTNALIHEVVYDTRKIIRNTGVVFFALDGPQRNGHQFIAQAYALGIRFFVVQDLPSEKYPEAVFFKVNDCLKALQDLAKAHREKIKYPIVAIAGSIGKTTVKEWIHHLLAGQLHVVRSPKSYNSQLGVALSLLELPLDAELALIETAATKPGEMATLKAMTQPNFGVITNCLPRGNEFKDAAHFHTEIQILLNACAWVMNGEELQDKSSAMFMELARHIPFKDPVSIQNAKIAIACAQQFAEISPKNVASLPRLALRLETIDAINDSVIINDAYTLDLLAFEGSLAYIKTLAVGKTPMVCCYLKSGQEAQRVAIESLIKAYGIDEYYIWEGRAQDLPKLNNHVVLLKGNDHQITESILENWRLKRHSTSVTYDLSALRYNLKQYQQMLEPNTQVLVMVKAQAYGAGHGQWVRQLVRSGVNYLGVAYADEGRELRKLGIQTPILVMNAEPEAFDTCIEAGLEPAIYSLEHLDGFIRKLISRGQEAYPIHIKLDTGMHRLGMQQAEIAVLVETLLAQPEVQVKSIYSHMACADEPAHPMNAIQIDLFEKWTQQIMSALPYPVLRHLLNSEGAAQFPEAQYDMVRLGIGLFGVNHNPQFASHLKPVFSWRSSISQIKTLEPGTCVGYGCTEQVQQKQNIAIIPVGYADGFFRCLGSGQGGVYINGKFCPTIGRVCMDMIMVKVSDDITIKDEVEIIGPFQSLNDFAQRANTIPYEILTSISPRVQRTYTND